MGKLKIFLVQEPLGTWCRDVSETGAREFQRRQSASAVDVGGGHASVGTIRW